MDEMNSYGDEVFVAQCLVSMSKEEPRAPTPTVGQFNEPTSVSSDEECPIEDDEVVRLPMHYSRENMITALDLPDPNDWERGGHSSSKEW
jgi:hypothetical protein